MTQKKTKMAITLDALRAAVPARCFERRLAPSFAALARSLAVCIALFGAARLAEPLGAATAVAYALAQGTALTGLWVIAHECGHHAFSEYPWLDDAIGFVLHSALLVPYFSWQASHARHHAHLGHLVLGETWVPPTRADVRLVAPLARLVGTRVYGALYLVGALLVGWPAYLACNLTGGRAGLRYWKPFGYDHFSPTSALFGADATAKVAVSSIGCALAAYVAYAAWPASVQQYLAPLVVMNAWVVWYTMLHHTAPDVPHHGADAYKWLEGALGTVDRDYGAMHRLDARGAPPLRAHAALPRQRGHAPPQARARLRVPPRRAPRRARGVGGRHDVPLRRRTRRRTVLPRVRYIVTSRNIPFPPVSHPPARVCAALAPPPYHSSALDLTTGSVS